MRGLLQFGFSYIKKNLYGWYLLLGGADSLFGIVTPLLMGAVIDGLTSPGEGRSLSWLIGLFFLFGVVRLLMGLVQSYLGVKLENDAEYAANRHFLKQMYHTSYLNICQEDSAMLSQKLSSDVGCVVGFSVSFYRNLLQNIVFVCCIAAVLLAQSWVLCLVLFGLAFCYAGVYTLAKGKIYAAGYRVKQNQTSFYGKLCGLLFHMKSIRNNGFEEECFEDQDKEYHSYYRSLRHQVTVNNTFNMAIDLIALLAQTMLFFIGGGMVLEHRLSLGTLVAIINYFSMMLQSTDYFLGLGQSYQDARSSYLRLQPYEQMEQIQDGWKRPETVEQIDIQAMAFSYPEQKNLIWMDRSIKSGFVYWVRGKNGKGKSTFMNLLLGLFGRDYSGEITVDSFPAEEVNFGYLLKERVAIVEQEPYLLPDTLEKNLLCKAKDAESEETKQELQRLLAVFELEEFVKKQPKGLYTMCNAMNAGMSGGERQKIAIIRLLLSAADFWFLDEPTSSLDKNSVEKFYEEIEKRKRDHIILIISHEEPKTYERVIEMENIDDARRHYM